MTISNNSQSVKYTNDVIAANNPVGLIACLAKQGINVPTGSTEILLSNLLDEIFNNDRAKWVSIVKCVPFNPSVNNWTTRAETIADLNMNANSSAKFDISGLFQQIGDFFGGSSTSGGGSQTTKNSISGGTAAIVTIIISAIIALVIWKA